MRPDDDNERPRHPRDDEEGPRQAPQKSGGGLMMVLLVVGGVLFLGCAACGGVGYWLFSKGKEVVEETQAKIEAAQVEAKTAGLAGERPAEQPAVATLRVKELLDRKREYDGKWVIATGRVQRVHRIPQVGKSERGWLLMEGTTRAALTCDFGPDEWALLPKFDDKRDYQVIGLMMADFDKLTWCRVINATADKDIPAVKVADLVREPEKYRGKTVFVSGVVNTADPQAKSVTLESDGPRKVVCLLTSGFNRLLKNGRGGTAELRATVGEISPAQVTLSNCEVIADEISSGGHPLQARTFLTRFDRGAANADANNRGKKFTVTGKVESVSPTRDRVVIAGDAGKGKTKAAMTIAAEFAPEWGEALAGVKAGDTVIVSGEYAAMVGTEVRLAGCWLVPDRKAPD